MALAEMVETPREMSFYFALESVCSWCSASLRELLEVVKLRV